jgi:hypothetical protein
LIQSAHTEEALIAQGGQDLPFANLYSGFDVGLVAGTNRSRREHDRPVVLRHLRIAAMRDGLAAQLLVDLFPVGQGSGRRARPRLGGAAQQLLDQLLLSQFLRQRPVQPDAFSSLEVVAHGTDRQAATAGDFAYRQLMFMFESEQFFNLTHN